MLAAERGTPGGRYVATAHDLDNLALLRAIDRAAGRKRRYVRMPAAVVRAAAGALDSRARKTGKPPLFSREFVHYGLKPSFFSNERSVRELGMKYRPLDETLADAIADFRRRGVIPR